MSQFYYSDNFFKYSSALFAFIIWGGWAFFINQKITAALVQGTSSFIFTTLIVSLVNYLFTKFNNKYYKMIMPAIISTSIIAIILITAHNLAQTSQILKTISLPLTAGFIFCLVTTFRLIKIK